MTAAKRTRSLCRPASLAGLVMFVALTGCKSKDGSAGSRDPLVHGPNRIPPQNVPLPERGVGAKGPKADPLIGAPTGKPREKSGISYNDDPARFKGSHIPGPGTTPAALAGKTKNDDELKIDTPDNRVPLQPAGGVAPSAGESVAGVDALYREMEKYGVRREDRSLARENGQFICRAALTNPNGTKRSYTGTGDTAHAAVKQVLDQIAAER